MVIALFGENDATQKRDSQARAKWGHTQTAASGPKPAGLGAPQQLAPFPASPTAGENRVRFPRQHVTCSTRVHVLALNHPTQQFAPTNPRIGTSEERISSCTKSPQYRPLAQIIKISFTNRLYHLDVFYIFQPRIGLESDQSTHVKIDGDLGLTDFSFFQLINDYAYPLKVL